MSAFSEMSGAVVDKDSVSLDREALAEDKDHLRGMANFIPIYAGFVGAVRTAALVFFVTNPGLASAGAILGAGLFFAGKTGELREIFQERFKDWVAAHNPDDPEAALNKAEAIRDLFHAGKNAPSRPQAPSQAPQGTPQLSRS